jgi:hypothetical protein
MMMRVDRMPGRHIRKCADRFSALFVQAEDS